MRVAHAHGAEAVGKSSSHPHSYIADRSFVCMTFAWSTPVSVPLRDQEPLVEEAVAEQSRATRRFLLDAG